MSKATATRRSGYTHDVTIGEHSLVADEPTDKGGNDAGPSPTDLLAAALASCTAITMEMYADRKEWELPDLRVTVTQEVHAETKVRSFDVCIHLPGGLSEEQTQRLRQIAGKCPVHKALAGESTVSIHDRVETDL
jgi:putative redox protein